jgi:transposase-like protein
VRSADSKNEVTLESYEHFTDRDPLTQVALERMLCGVSTRRFGRTQEPVGEVVERDARSTSKSAISRAFIARTKVALDELMSRDLGETELAALMIDGIDLSGRVNVVALGITTGGEKVPLGLWEGSSENATVVKDLLCDLQGRGLATNPSEAPMLFVIDGSKALAKGIRTVFGNDVPIQRCIRHKERNVLDYLPEPEREWVSLKLRAAWDNESHSQALASLKALATSLEKTHPGAAASLKEGMEETLTVNRFRVTGALKRSLSSTNPIE